MVKKEGEPLHGLTEEEWEWYKQHRKEVPHDLQAIKWAYKHREDGIPPVLPDEIGSRKTWGPHNRTTHVEHLDDSRIGPRNRPNNPEKSRTFELWPIEGHESTTKIRDTEDKALEALVRLSRKKKPKRIRRK